MKNIEYLSRPILYENDREISQVKKYQERYLALVEKLGKLGSQVRMSRILEIVNAGRIRQFINEATHEFIFPPQQSESRSDDMRVYRNGQESAYVHEHHSASYDPNEVRGRIEVRYDDSANAIIFKVKDLQGDSRLPAPVLTELEELRATTSTSRNND